MIEHRLAAFSRGGRGNEWKALKKITNGMIKRRKKRYYDNELAKLKEEGSHQLPYKVLRNIADTERPMPWTLDMLDRTKLESEIGEDLVQYFSNISNEFRPLRRTEIPKTYSRQLEPAKCEEIAGRLRSMKKPSLSVEMDPMTRFIAPHVDKWAQAVTPIINYARLHGRWPAAWKREEGTVIPKQTNPESPDQLRNVSCMSIFVKLCET